MRMQRTKKLLASVLTGCVLAGVSMAQDTSYSVHELKAGILYSILLFTEWDAVGDDDPSSPVIIGVLGSDPFPEGAFDEAKKMSVSGRPLVVISYDADTPVKTLSECSMLFVPARNVSSSNLEKRLKALQEQHVLTVGEQDGFLQKGGMINLLAEKRRIGFEINADTAGKAGIRFRSKLLRLARRVFRAKAQREGDK